MNILGAAIVLAMILYLVDKNHKWRPSFRVCGVLGLLAAAVIGYAVWNGHREARRAAQGRLDIRAAEFEAKWNATDYPRVMSDTECAQMVRKAYPGAYDDLEMMPCSYGR